MTENLRMTSGPDGPSLPDTSRVEVFSDGVLAVAITLLVLDLHVPASQPGQLRSGLLAEWPAYLSFLASFLYVGVLRVVAAAAMMQKPSADVRGPVVWLWRCAVDAGWSG